MSLLHHQLKTFSLPKPNSFFKTNTNSLLNQHQVLFKMRTKHFINIKSFFCTQSNHFLQMQINSLEKRLKAIEGHNIFGLDSINMWLVPNVTLPPKFKVPNFEKYKGLSCPKGRLIIFCRKMASYSCNGKLMVNCFQNNLTEASL